MLCEASKLTELAGSLSTRLGDGRITGTGGRLTEDWSWTARSMEACEVSPSLLTTVTFMVYTPRTNCAEYDDFAICAHVE